MLYRTVRTTEEGAARRLSLSSCTYTHTMHVRTRRNHLSTSEDRKEEVRELSRKSVPALYTQVTPGLAKAGMERFFSTIPVDNLVHHIRETRALLLSRENNISSRIDFSFLLARPRSQPPPIFRHRSVKGENTLRYSNYIHV